jgi:predicted ester cyclase
MTARSGSIPLVDTILRAYYTAFNQRRFADAATLLTPDAMLDHVPFGQQRGGDAYVRFATTWCLAFPDAALTVERVDQRGENIVDVHLLGTGTHLGLLDFGSYRFKPTGTVARLHMRETLTIADDKIAASTLSFDVNDLVAQLSPVDYTELIARLKRIRQLSDELFRSSDSARERDIVSQLGPELDAARRALRPHYNR